MTPQQTLVNLHPQIAAQSGGSHSVPTMAMTYPNMGYSVSFDGTPTNQQPQMLMHSQPAGQNYSQSFSNGPVSNPGFARSFGGEYGSSKGFAEKPQIYTAVYSGVQVYEMDVGGVACMRRRTDGWLNATQILKIAGVEKGKRTKVLEKEILPGEHEKVQGGYGKYQGTWISYKRGRDFCRAYGVEEILRPLLDYDVSADGSGGQGQDTPTKEQAMAANRKRFYNSSLDARSNGPVSTNGTFFQSISPTTSVALAAMNKAARLNTPAPRPLSVSQRPSMARQSSQMEGISASQQSMNSQNSFAEDSGYSTQPNGEPPRKRMRRDSSDLMAPPDLPIDVPMSPTEPNESFVYEGLASQDLSNANGEPIASAALPSPSSPQENEKLNLILDLFAEQGKIDYAQHPALRQLSGEDFNIPLDASANSALHWAATLAKVPLLKLLVRKGANIWRGNAAGQSPLISAVIVNNCWEHRCFPELLELLSPLIEVRDVQGRTVLHHIAVSSGIKGRAPSSKYYLEALLEFLVRIGRKSVAESASQRNSGDLMGLSQDSVLDADKIQKAQNAVSLVRFLSHIVNARDKAGNTALNLVARIGNRSIIQQLLEIHADPTLPNHKGITAKDFGVGTESTTRSSDVVASQSQHAEVIQTDDSIDPALVSNGSQAEDLGQDVIETMTTMLKQNLAKHKDLLRQRTDEVDILNAQLREFSATHKTEHDRVQALQSRVKLREERRKRITNLRREIEERRKHGSIGSTALGSADEFLMCLTNLSSSDLDKASSDVQLPDNLSQPTLQLLNASMLANNDLLKRKADALHQRSSELEGLYRRVVSLCTGVPEDRVVEALPSLVAAVESERSVAAGLGEDTEVSRVRDFLKRVDRGQGSISAMSIAAN